METLTYGPQTSEVKAFLMKVESVSIVFLLLLVGFSLALPSRSPRGCNMD